MKTALRKLVVTAAIAASIPAAAFARDCDHDARPVPLPAPAGYYEGGWQGGDHDGWRRERHERRDAWREQERARIRAEYAHLDERRAEFYARFGWNPRKVDRFERWYAWERAELDRRWNAVSWYAAR
jgi:hypothetical protein